MVLDKVILRHDRTSLLHTLEINLRIPLVLTQIKKGDLLGAPFKLSSKPLKTQGNQLSTRSLYSTVVKSPPIRRNRPVVGRYLRVFAAPEESPI